MCPLHTAAGKLSIGSLTGMQQRLYMTRNVQTFTDTMTVLALRGSEVSNLIAGATGMNMPPFFFSRGCQDDQSLGEYF